jgi:mediator of replication checkpoint protein 1
VSRASIKREAGLTCYSEVAQADDARREAEAKKVTEGHLRQKRRGNEFFSEDEDEDGRPRKWTKKQRRQRRLERDDGLFKLGDEANVFVQAYEEDLDTDNEDDEAPPSPTFMSPIKATTAQERMELLRARARVEVTVSVRDTFRHLTE